MKRRVEVSTRKKGYARCKSLILPGAGKYRNAVASGLLSCPDFCESDCTSTRRYRVTVLTRSTARSLFVFYGVAEAVADG